MVETQGSAILLPHDQRSRRQLLTCVVPTRDRPALLRRLLRYFEAIELPFPVLIADSSQRRCAEENAETARHAARVLDLVYVTSTADFMEKCEYILENVSTPYVRLCGDDDFIFPDASRYAVELLQTDPSCSAAMGITVSLHMHRRGRCYALPGYTIANDSPVVRFRRMADLWFSTVPAVHRTETLHEAFQVTGRWSDYLRARVFSDILFSQMAVLRGRIRFFGQVGYLRAEHDQNHGRHPPLEDVAHAHMHYARFRRCLSGHLEEAGATLDHARQMVDQWYGYLESGSLSSVQKWTPMAKTRREALRHYRQLMSLFRGDRILQRRRLRRTDLIGQEHEWREAHRLIVEFPDGIPLDAKRRVA